MVCLVSTAAASAASWHCPTALSPQIRRCLPPAESQQADHGHMPLCTEIRAAFRELRGQCSTSGPGQTWESALCGEGRQGAAPQPHTDTAWCSWKAGFTRPGGSAALQAGTDMAQHSTAQHGSPSEGEVTQQCLRPAQTPYNALGGRVLRGPEQGSTSDPH